MGALRINRKRGDDYFTLNGKFPSLGTPNSPKLDERIDTHISKKQKTSSFSNPCLEQPLQSTASRVSRYPAPVNPIRREVHAPCRVSRFGFLAKLNKESSAGRTGNFLSSRSPRGKNLDFSSFGHVKNVKEVIDVEAVSARDGVGGDSSMEDVENAEYTREWQSLALDRGSEETSGDVINFPSSEGKKIVEYNVQPSSAMTLDTANENAEVANMDLLSLNQKLEALGMPMHKKLLETAGRRDPKLSSLKFQIELNEKRLASLQSLYPVKKPQEEDILQDLLREPFVPLTDEEDAEVSSAFSKFNRRKVLATHENSNIEITGEHMQCLRPGAWLNDEVINVYLELLKERETREPKKFLKCHFFNTFFYKKLIGGRNGYDYKSVRRWTTQRKLGYSLSECDKIFVPIHKEIHWCLAVINKKDQKFQYLDSLGGVDGKVLNVLARYFADEVKDKNGEHIDVNSWEQEFVEDLPEQKNGWDCGVFMIKYADFYSRGLGLCFNQEHMPYFRRRTVKEILRLKAE